MPNIEVTGEPVSLILPIPEPPVVELIYDRAMEDGFATKQEFHVTILPHDSLEQVEEHRRSELIEFLAGQAIDDCIVRGGEVYHCIKPKRIGSRIYRRESLISPVTSRKTLRLLGAAGRHITPLEYPFLHVTLFTRGDEPYASRGIGIDNVLEFEEMRPTDYFLSRL